MSAADRLTDEERTDLDERCFGTHVIAEVDCPVHGEAAYRPAPDTLAAHVQALAEEWERNYAAMLIGGFSGCSISADTAAKRLRALLAGRPDASPEGGGE